MAQVKRILVTGGMGFTGFHLVKYLLSCYNNPEITVVDNLSSGVIDFGNIKSHIKIHIIDLKDFTNYDRYDHIYHLASPVGSLGILKFNGYVAKEIIDLTYKVLDITMHSNAKLLYISSSEVYGHDGLHNEEAVLQIGRKIGTRTEYALGKITSEIILQNLTLTNDLNYNIVRPFNIIGEYQCSKIGFVVPTFFENAIKNADIPVFYDGIQVRSFCHIEDLVRAYVMIQESDIKGEIFNAGNDRNLISIKELAVKIKSFCHSRSNIVHYDPVNIFGKSYIEAFNKIPVIDKIKSKINWLPSINLDDALERVYKCYKSGNNQS